MGLGWSLQARFLLATSVLAIVLCAAFAITVHQFIELLEDELLNRTLVREMQEFKTDVAADPRARPPAASGLNGYIVRTPADRATLPQALAQLAPGVHEDIRVHDRLCYVAVDDVPGARLYVVLDTERVEAIESGVVSVAVAFGLVALGLAAAIGVILSRAVLRPVTELANSVAHLDPAHRNERLTKRFANKEVGIIATAFDNYMERLERVLEREQAFTEDASHELRTPLAIIGSAAELLMEEPTLSTAARDRVLRIRRASAQMQSLIEALLFLARGEQHAATQTSALDQIVRESVEVIAATASAKSLTVTVTTEPVPVVGSPVMIACVINNLMLNAVNFTQAGTIEVNLTSAELTVRDSGIGIPPQDLSRIFERRYRGAHSRGLGLGLYLVSRICERLGWQIDARSAPEQGTTFRIRLAPGPVAARLPAGGT